MNWIGHMRKTSSGTSKGRIVQVPRWSHFTGFSGAKVKEVDEPDRQKWTFRHTGRANPSGTLALRPDRIGARKFKTEALPASCARWRISHRLMLSGKLHKGSRMPESQPVQWRRGHSPISSYCG